MSDYLDKVRMVVAKREDEQHPLVIAAIPESTYDYIEVIATIPNVQLAAMFAARSIAPTSIALADEQGEGGEVA